MTITVASLHVHPIKSCRAMDLVAVRFDPLGPLYDRRFMIVDDAGRFLTQRELPKLATITPRLGPTSLLITAPHMPQLKVAMTQHGARTIEIEVWRFKGPAEDVGDHAADWLSSLLERPCRLVRWSAAALREVNPSHARTQSATAFTDGYPVLLMNEGSVEDLGKRVGQRVAMNRFRPNLVVRGAEPYAEDAWRRIRVGELELDVVKPCTRCVTTTTDQLTGERGKEPLATLATYRAREGEVVLGQNCVHMTLGSVRVGDEVEVLESA
jgi:uncharacterized protein YcbX